MSQVQRCVFLGLLLLPAPVFAQDGIMDRYRAQVATTVRGQPHWATPLITTSALIEQGFRADFVRQTTANGQTVWSYGNTKGMQIIPLPRTELRISPPAYLSYSDPKLANGFSDVAFRLKYRFYGSNEEHHNAILSAVLLASLPTGQHAAGSCCAIVSPTLEFGKGVGKLALTTTVGGTLPVTNAHKLGHSVVWNNAIEYRLLPLVTVETEFNSTFYHGGKFDGKEQTFTTPGIILGRIPLIKGGASGPPLSFTVGAGEQIALTHFHSYNHSPIFTGRLRF